ncbi:MAG TPA: hypothetical protein VHF05_00320 [Candidatus Paceibacterota bacterium]|nr:hypothetical protein [Candidatus Paceibacterota bacterium]
MNGERDLLERILDLTEENNKILRKIERANRWSLIFRIIYWLFVIGAAVGIYYYIQPYQESLIHAYQTLQSFVDQMHHLGQ